MMTSHQLTRPLRSERQARADHVAGESLSRRERRLKIQRLHELVGRLDHSAAAQQNSSNPGAETLAGRLKDDAYAVRWALDYVARHVNLTTGELTVSDNEEAAG